MVHMNVMVHTGRTESMVHNGVYGLYVYGPYVQTPFPPILFYGP